MIICSRCGKNLNDKSRICIVCLEECCEDVDNLKQQRDDLLATVKNALVSLAVISMPREDNNVATNAEILKIMGDSFRATIAKAKP